MVGQEPYEGRTETWPPRGARPRVLAGPRPFADFAEAFADRVRRWAFAEAVPGRERSDRIVVRALKVEGARLAEKPNRVRVSIRKGTVPPVGSYVSFRARLNSPLTPLRPGGYDFARDLYFQKIGAVGFVLGQIKTSEATAPPGFWLNYAAAVEGARDAINARIRAVDTAKAIEYSLKRWPALTRFLGDGRLCISNNAAERALRGIAVGRHNWTFAGSDEGGRRAAAIYTLIETAKLNDIDPQAWLADVLARLPDHPAKRIADLLPWNWRPQNRAAEAA